MVSIRGMVRFEMNRPLFLANIKEPERDSIYRRSRAIETKGRFIPKGEYGALPNGTRAAGNIFAKGDTMGRFIEIRHAGAAFFDTIYEYMNSRTMGASGNTIYSYAWEEGTAWRVIRNACNRPLGAPPLDISPNSPAAYDEAVK